MSTSSVAISSSTGRGVAEPERQGRLEDELTVARAALDLVTEGLLVVDTRAWRILQLNAPAQVLLGLDDAPAPGFDFGELCRRLRAEDGSVPTPASLVLATPLAGEFRYAGPAGAVTPLALRAARARAGRREVLVLSLRDVSEQVRSARELGSASTRCGITFSQAAVGLAHLDLDGSWTRVNARLAAILGYTEAELLGLSAQEVTHPEDRVHDASACRRLLDGDIPYHAREKRYLRKDGSVVWVSVNSSLARDEAGTPLYFIAMVEDISERRHAERRIRHLATHDAMTGLPNRAGLQRHLEGALGAARHGGLRLGVVFVDMDKLKEINDSRGHEAGDRALVGLAQQLRAAVRADDMVARIGGDEFLIVLADVAGRAGIAATLERIMRMPAAASTSIGVSVYPDDGEDARTLIRNADLAMYRAKHDGGAGYVFYSDVPAAQRAPRLVARTPRP